MRIFLPLVVAASGATALAASSAPPPLPELPLVHGRKALASVNGQPVTWTAFRDALASVHEDVKEGSKRAKQDPQALLERLITAKLVVQEARNIGLDQDPAFKASVENWRLDTMQKMLLERAASKVTRPDPADVRSIYVTRVGVARIDSLLFKVKGDADAFVASLKRGRDFSGAAPIALAAGQATWEKDYPVKLAEAQPEVAGAIAVLQPGQSSRALAIKDGWTVLRLIDLKVPEDPVARRESEEQALDFARLQAVGAYTKDLRRRYASVDEPLLASLDFEAKEPGFAALKKDARIVARVTGQPPITVADIAAAVEANFFHGLERAIEKKQVNLRKPFALDELLVKRLAVSEGTRLGIQRTPEFQEQEEEFAEGLLFGAFVKRVIVPDVRVDEAQVRTYYDAHAASYTSPAMLRLDSIAFAKRSDADDALKKAREGADFGWLKQNAAGRISSDDVMQLNGGVFTVGGVDPDMAKVLASPKSGEARLFTPEDGKSYVVLIRDVIPSKTTSFDEAREEVGRQVVNENLKKSLDDWSVKLRRAYEVKTFVTPAQLDSLVKREFGLKA